MSMLGSFSDILKSAARGAAVSVINSYLPAVGYAPQQSMGGFGSGTSAGGVMSYPSTTRVGTLPGLAPLAMGLVNSLDPTVEGSVGDYLVPDMLVGTNCSPRKLKSGRVRYPRHRANGTCYFPRRMNPLNPTAARKAIRRIKAVRRITRDIERSLPRVSTRRR